MRSLTFHRLLSRAALAAMLLLATLPTLGRIAAHAPPMSHALAMHHGHAMPATPERGRLPPPPGHQHAEDCAYCAVLSGAIPTAIPDSPAATTPPSRWAMSCIATSVRAAGGPGLGARGPPPVRA